MSWEYRDYRFTVRTPGGGEQKVAIIPLPVPALEGEHPAGTFTDLKWEQEEFDHGAEVKMSAKVQLKDKPVRFVVESKEGDRWVHHSTVPAVVKDGIATALLRAHHPALPPTGSVAAKALGKAAELRFRAEEGHALEQLRAEKVPVHASIAPPPLPHTTRNLHLFHLDLPHPALEKPAAQKGPEGVLDAKNADTVLKRGDILIKFAGESSSTTEKIIMTSQKVIQKLSGAFHAGIKKGDASCFHAALYLGGGRTVEAHGGDISTARVGTRSFDEHAGFLFQVYRCKDQALADEAAKVGETWGNRRMHYQVPANIPFHTANFGHFAHKQSLDFGKHAGTAGGPPDFSKMFCSEFVIAVWQAAVVARQLKKKPKLKAGDVQMPLGVDLHASNASPLALDAKLVEGVQKNKWEHVAEILVRPQEQADAPPEGPPGKDVTGKLAVLGNPTQARWPSGKEVYARNPWSLRVFDGKLHVASGNSNNKGPAPNVGPIDLWAFDPKANKFAVEYVVADEQVDVMHKIDDALWIPGHDSHVTGRRTSTLEKAASVPTDWAFGNTHHRKLGGPWEQLRTIKNGIHVYDVISFDRKLFAAVSTVIGGTVARSEDGGLSWHEMVTYEKPGQRTRSLFVLGGKLHASTTGGRVYVWDGGKKMTHLGANFFPGVESATECFAARPTAFNGQVAFIAARKIIDHDWSPVGLFLASPPDAVKAAPLPGGAMPRDFLVDSGKLYALASSQPGEKKTRVHVFVTADLQKWDEVLRFDAATFARSFELLGADFCFGMGCDPELLDDATGNILRLPASALR